MSSSSLDEQSSLLSKLNLSKSEWTIKVRVISLWEQQDRSKSEWTIKVRVQANVTRQWWVKFRHFLRDGASVYITKFNIGKHIAKYKIIDHPFKLNLWSYTTVKECKNFSGSEICFKATSFHDILANKVSREGTIDIIVEVITCGKLCIIEESGKRRSSLEIQDLEGQKLNVTLWSKFADEITQYVENMNPDQRVIIILQFAKIDSYNGRPFVANAFIGSKLFINSEIPEIIQFRERSEANDGGAGSSRGVTITTTKSYSMKEDFLVDHELKFSAEILGLKEETMCIFVGTVVCIDKDFGWYYLGCGKCKTKARRTWVIEDKKDGSGEFDEKEIFQCPKHVGDVIDVVSRFMFQLRVQDASGVLSLKMLDTEAANLLQKSAYDMCERNLEKGDMDFFPPEFDDLVDKKFAFKIKIGNYNLEKDYKVFTICKLTNDEKILLQLEKKSILHEPTISDSMSIGSFAIPSDGTSCFKDSVSYTGENITPGTLEKSTADSPPSIAAENKRKSTSSDVKRKLDDVYVLDELEKVSSSKFSSNRAVDNDKEKKKAKVIDACKQKLLIPKLEK